MPSRMCWNTKLGPQESGRREVEEVVNYVRTRRSIYSWSAENSQIVVWVYGSSGVVMISQISGSFTPSGYSWVSRQNPARGLWGVPSRRGGSGSIYWPPKNWRQSAVVETSSSMSVRDEDARATCFSFRSPPVFSGPCSCPHVPGEAGE